MVAFVTGAALPAQRSGRTALCRRVPAAAPAGARTARVRMGLGEDGLKEDLDFAQGCIDEGCSIDAVQQVLTRLEQRRAVLALEVSNIEEIMATLARENLGGDRNLVTEAMEAAVRIFSKVDDNYPTMSPPSGYTMDPLKKQPKY